MSEVQDPWNQMDHESSQQRRVVMTPRRQKSKCRLLHATLINNAEEGYSRLRQSMERLRSVRLPQRPSSRCQLIFARQLNVTWLREHCGLAEPTRRDICLPTAGRTLQAGVEQAIRDSLKGGCVGMLCSGESGHCAPPKERRASHGSRRTRGAGCLPLS